ncbi:MAG TPA: HD domain-containing protein, partial [Bacteroidota bacterium]
IGHSVRTIGECLSLRAIDVESWVSLLESRHLCGNKQLYGEFRRQLRAQIRQANREAFVQDLADRIGARHQKYGQSTKLLEPNVKNSAGGLRDLHSVLWLLLGSGTIQLPSVLPARETALTWLLKTLFIHRHFPPSQLRETRSALDILLRTRNAMHLESKGLHDSLEFTFQRQVAESLRFKSSPTRSSVEQFMQQYYVASRSVAQFSRRISGLMQRTVLRTASRNVTELDNRFVLTNGQIAAVGRTTMTTEVLLGALRHAAGQKAALSEELEDAVAKFARRASALKSRKEAALFREFLNLPQGVGSGIQILNEFGILERWIPEWKPLVAFFQHNQYHYYTADEHTLRVVANAESLSGESDGLGKAFGRLSRRDVLYLACLLHDIAKPQRVGDHEITGAAVARKVLKRLRCDDIADDVAFLVRHHLLMEQVAFRRNLNDPQTIIDFSSRIPRTHLLDYLYVLTYSDLSAVNKTVWTDWKGMLLFELYRKSREVLEKRLSGEQVRQAASSRRDEAVQQIVQTLAGIVPGHVSQNHLQAVDNADYLAAFDAGEIAEHIRRIERNEPVAALFRHQRTISEVTIIARDQPFALSRFCGVLSANDANILDAHIFTRNDGIIIDKFRVTDFLGHTQLSENQAAKIRQELTDVLTGTTDIHHLLKRHRMKWKRLTKPQNPNARIGVEFEDHPLFSIIDVFAPDRLGFLYKITESISSLGLNISSAKIATRADGIVDSFYVLDRNGKKIDSTERSDEIRTSLVKTIADVAESELTPG